MLTWVIKVFIVSAMVMVVSASIMILYMAVKKSVAKSIFTDQMQVYKDVLLPEIEKMTNNVMKNSVNVMMDSMINATKRMFEQPEE